MRQSRNEGLREDRLPHPLPIPIRWPNGVVVLLGRVLIQSNDNDAFAVEGLVQRNAREDALEQAQDYYRHLPPCTPALSRQTRNAPGASSLHVQFQGQAPRLLELRDDGKA